MASISSESAGNSPATTDTAVTTPATSVEDNDALVAEGARMGPVDDPAEIPVDKRNARLMFLIKQSSVYASIIGEKMEQQQNEMRVRAAKQAETKEERKTKDEEPPAAKGKKKRGGTRATKKTDNKPMISDYFNASDVQNSGSTTKALASAAEEEGTIRLGAQKDLHQARQPRLITGGVMKEYQLVGLEWLVTLYENGLNGILADEMGLGKTLQTISFLAFLKEKGTHGPFLVAAPVSTLANWVDEIERFAPDIPAVMYHGTPLQREEIRRTRMKRVDKNFPIVCTSYDLIMNDKKFLQTYNWKFIIIDEGHRIKNLNCKLIRELKSYTSANRLLITGTPLQNDLSELWSLLNFLLPDIFDDLDNFQGWFDFSKLQEKEGRQAFFEEEKKNNIVGSLHAILKPFLLRRLKIDVETTLPPKREYLLNAGLTQLQKDLYGKLIDGEAKGWLIEKLLASQTKKKRKLVDTDEENPKKSKKIENGSTAGRERKAKTKVQYEELSDHEYFKKLDEESEEEEGEEIDEEKLMIMKTTKEIGTKKLQNLVMQLRQTCNSPHLFYWPWVDTPDETLVTGSGKMVLLDRLVPALFERGHKVLIFSQFTRMLDIIEDWADTLRGWPVCRIDGGISQEIRREQIRRFNKDKGWNLFLLSTRAGGLGINLTAADSVILFDSDWNPQQDLQAMDRAHRIGQKNPVIVYRFTTASTVESVLLEKAGNKRLLEKLVIQKGKFKSHAATSHQADEDDLSTILLREDFEKVNILQEGEKVLSDEDLETILDRSPEAYERFSTGREKASAAFKAVEPMKTGDDPEVDPLAGCKGN